MSVQISFDWLSMSLNKSLLGDMLTFLKAEKIPCEYGFRGYRQSALLIFGGRVAWSDDREDCHIDLNSQSLAYFSKGTIEGVMSILNKLYEFGGKLSRLDVAFDDRSGKIGLDGIIEAIWAKDWVSKSYNFRVMESAKNSNSKIDVTGKTVYIGSSKSSTLLRIYDKGLETGNGDSWVRYEIQYRDNNSNLAASKLIQSFQLGLLEFIKVSIGLLRSVCDFREFNSNENSSRRVLLSWWSDIVNGAVKVTLGKVEIKHSMDKVMDWLEYQVSSNLALARKYYGSGFMNVVNYLTEVGESKFKQKHKMLLMKTSSGN
ncbi:MAG: replication initiation factor domain-containing protein [Candidatus Jettenia sp.]|nr:MAG: replication initiation factor domain-containing protein [Candidatus Jettenia sp.]